MKRMAVALSLFFFVFAFAAAQTIEVTSPKGGESWLLGSSKTITWTATGFPAGTKARLALLLNGTKLGDIAVNVPISQGSWTWAKAGDYVGGTADPGGGYAVRVRDMNNHYPGAKSPAKFTFASLSNIGQIAIHKDMSKIQGISGLITSFTVTSPGQGEAFKPGNHCYVIWDKPPIADYPKVALGLYTPDRKTFINTLDTLPDPLHDNTGSFLAFIFDGLHEVGKEYVIRVATPDGKHVGWSGVFRVIPLEAVPVTETYKGSNDVSYMTTGESDWPGCLNTLGQAPTVAPLGLYAVGWENSNDDPTGPCWSYVGHVYRTIVHPSGIYKGFEITKAVLHFAVPEGVHQTFYVLRRDSSSDTLSAPTTTVATVGNWEFGHDIAVDVTAVVQGWCTGQIPNYGLIIRGGNEGFDHNDVKALCLITPPELIVTKITYK